jgi:hypothetical protein
VTGPLYLDERHLGYNIHLSIVMHISSRKKLSNFIEKLVAWGMNTLKREEIGLCQRSLYSRFSSSHPKSNHLPVSAQMKEENDEKNPQ